MILKFKLKESQQVSSLREHFGLGGHQGGQEESSRGRHSAELTLTLPDETALIRQDVKPCSGQPPISQAPGQLEGVYRLRLDHQHQPHPQTTGESSRRQGSCICIFLSSFLGDSHIA